MYIYCNGDSNTRGTHWSLKNHDRKLTWPFRLAKALDSKLVNQSKEGASNFRILKTSIDAILAMKEKPELTVIQWTYNERFITPLGVNEQNPEEPLGFRTHNPYAVSQGAPPTRFQPFYNSFFNPSSIDQRMFLEEQTYFYMFLLQTFLEQMELEYIFLTFETKERKTTKQANAYLNLLNKDKFLHDPLISMESILDSFNYERSKAKIPDGRIDHHYKEDAHDFICESILDFYILKDVLKLKSNKKTQRGNSIIHFYGDDM